MTALIQCGTNRVRWWAPPDWEPILFGPRGLRLAEWHRQGHVKVVKDGPHRTVYSVELADRAFYVKHYRCNRFWDVARHLVRTSSARREWRKVMEVARRGIPTVKPVGWQEQLCGGVIGECYFIAETIPHACSVEQYVLKWLPELPPDAQRTMRRPLIESLARFTAAVHRAGILHNDFHAGNVLLRLDRCHADAHATDSPLELYLIDVPGVRFSGPLGWSASRENLVVLNSAWWKRTSEAERWRFWRTYQAQRPDLDVPERRSAIEQLESGSHAYFRRKLQRRDKRALRNNRDYQVVQHPWGKAHSVRDLAAATLNRLLEDPDALLWRNLNRPVKLERGSLIVEAQLPLAGGEVHVVYKRYRPWNWWKAVLGKFRRGRALRGWYLGHALLLRQIATARPLAVCDVRRPWYRCQSYLAIEWIDGSENLHLYGWRLLEREPCHRFRRAAQCAESLGKMIGKMHARQVFHGDLKGTNLLVVERESDVQTYLVDADGVRIADRLTSARRAADLARLAVSVEAHPWVTRTIRRRFLRAYVEQFPPGVVAWKSLWRDVARRSRQITRRKRRRREPIL